MRVVIFDDDGGELAQGKVDDLTVNGETMRLSLSATVTPQWHALPEGGRPASASITALMKHVVAVVATQGKVSVKYSSGPAQAAVSALTEMFNA